MFAAALPIAGAVLGGIAGSQGDRKSSTSRMQLDPASELETRGGDVALSQLNDLEKLLGAGPGQRDVQQSTQSQRSLAEMLTNFSQGGFLPSQQDIGGAQQLAQQLFAGQQEGLNQAFNQQRIQSSRNAARMGRSAIDPVLQNMLAQGQTQQQGQLNANIGSFAAQRAQELPQQRLAYAQQLAQVNQGLASQAMANRQALLGMGSQLQSQGQQFRLGTASRTVEEQSGGGLQGALTGALGGLSSFAGAGQALQGMNFGSFFGGGAGAAAQGTAGTGLASKFGSIA